MSFIEPFVILALLIGLGALVGRLRVVDARGVAQLSSLVVNVTLPATIFAAVVKDISRDILASAPTVVLLGVAVGAVTWWLGRMLGRWRAMPPERLGVYAFAASCSNTGFLGIPLVAAILGPGALVTAVLFDFATTINIFGLGVAGLAAHGQRHDYKRVLGSLLNPMFLALVVAVAWGATGLCVPETLMDVVEAVGDTTTPLAMIALGHMFYEASRQPHAALVDIGLLGGVRLVLAPAIVLAVIWSHPMPLEVKAVCVLQAGMPTAMLTPILARRYHADHRLGLDAALLTTAASLVTLPLWAWLVQRVLHLGPM